MTDSKSVVPGTPDREAKVRKRLLEAFALARAWASRQKGVDFDAAEDIASTVQRSVLNNTLADYKIATMMDLPEIVSIIVEAGHPEGPFGAKGIGEPAAAPAAPAIANAVFDAIGVRIKDLPITPEKIRAALKSSGR